MRRLWALMVLSILLSSCAAWDAGDRGLMASYLALSAADAVQISRFDRRDLEEANPLFRKENGEPDMEKTLIFKCALALGIWYLADSNPRFRTEVLVGANAIQGGVVVWNIYKW